MFMTCLLLQFCIGCKINKAKSKFLQLEKSAGVGYVLPLSDFICDFYIENGQFPSNKSEYDAFVGQKDEEIARYLREIRYDFILHDSTLELVENLTKDDTLVIISVSEKNCQEIERNELSHLILLSKNQDVAILYPDLSMELNKIIKDHVAKLRNDSTSVFVPKDNKVTNRLSVVQMKRDGDWSANIIASEHNIEDLQTLMNQFLDLVNDDSLLIGEIDYIRIPILYYENSDLISLQK